MSEELSARVTALEGRVSNLEKKNRPQTNTSWRFPNGNFFFRNGVQIDPRSEEGQKIIEILKAQKENRALNDEQKKKFAETTQGN